MEFENIESNKVSRLNKIEDWVHNIEAKNPPKMQREKIKVQNNEREDGEYRKPSEDKNSELKLLLNTKQYYHRPKIKDIIKLS